MKKLGLSTGILMASLSADASPMSSLTFDTRAELRITEGKLYRKGELVLGGFSVIRSEPGFIFFYIPDFGLVTIAPNRFPGGERSGNFRGHELVFSAAGTDFVLTTSSSIVGDGESPAWVSVDAAYALKRKSAMIGYGNDARAPYNWPMYERK